MMYGYRRDPLSTKDHNGIPLVGDRRVQLWNQSLPDNDFETLKGKVGQAHSGDVDLSSFTTETDQYQLSACAGNATADSIEVLNAIQGKPRQQLSRLFVYNMARILAGDLDKDEGTFIRLCFEVLARFGICLEDDPIGGWPYDYRKVHIAPTLMAERQATGHKIHDYYRIRSDGDERLNDMVTALRANHPIVFGTTISLAFESMVGEGPVYPPKDGEPIGGGHAMMCVGFDTQKGFLVKNSWSRNWGSNGFCYFSPEYMTFGDTQDIWVPTLGIDFKPTDPL